MASWLAWGAILSTPARAADGPRELSKAFREAASVATPSVVTILSYGQSPATPRQGPDGNPVPEPDDQTLTGVGSGVVIDDRGYLITNNHVIARAKRVVVQMADDTRHDASEVIGDRASDVATLKIDLDEPAPAASIGDSDGASIGDWVLAIGSPFRLEATVSAGIISAKNRRLNRLPRSQLFQTDAAINPGNSGGPLVDLDGRVVAINTAIATRNGGYQGIGFAIPIKQATWIASELREHGRVRRAAIGVTMAELNRRIADAVNLEPGIGVLAYQVIQDSAADRAGVERLDVITDFAGTPVRTPQRLRELIEQTPIGSEESIVVLRDGESLTLKITLASIEDPTRRADGDDTPEPPAVNVLPPDVEEPTLEPEAPAEADPDADPGPRTMPDGTPVPPEVP